MLLAEIVFASRLLGLVAGEQHVAVNVDAEVRSVEVRRDGKLVAVLQKAPWSTMVSLGPQLEPHDLTVIAFDAQGKERGRDTQALNVARPAAELGILLDRNAQSHVTATIRWTHFASQNPGKMTVKVDGKKIGGTRPVASLDLGALDPVKIHVLGVEVVFPDGVQSRKEIVFGGVFSEEMPAELTPVGVRLRKEVPIAPAACFHSGDVALPNTTIEKGSGSALFVLNGGRAASPSEGPNHFSNENLFALLSAEIRVVDPVAKVIQRPEGNTSIFDSAGMDGTRGTRRLMNVARTPIGMARIADAAGAAALRALRGGQRRVVVVVLGKLPAPDRSIHSPATIRHYLERVGVPLRVWSLTGPRPDLADSWGAVRDVSNPALLLTATEDLRHELDSQRLAWLPVAPIEAFHVTADADCAYAPLAGDGYALVKPLDRDASAR
jgi:hypothetical protein